MELESEKIENKKHISYSQISTYTSCPAHYLFRYICGLKVPPKAVMAQGSAVHHSLAMGYGYKMQHKKDPKEDLLLEQYEVELKDKLENEVELSKKDDKPAKLLDDGVRVLKTYHKEKMPQVNPLAVEQEFNMDFQNKDYYLKGYIDLIDDKEKSGVDIVDHKMVGSSPSKNALYASEQLSTYALGYRQFSGKKENKVRFDYLVKTKIPKIITVEREITDYDLKKVLYNIAYVMQAIENEEFYCFHKPYEAWICAPQNCGYEHKGYHKELVEIGVKKFIEKYANRE